MDLARQTDVTSVGQSFDARCDVHTLTEIVEPIVKCDRNRRATMQAYLEYEIRLSTRSIKAGNL
jgi:hypothetical protein